MHGLVAVALVRFALQLQLGAEYDSNANRAEVVADTVDPDHPQGSFLLRTTARFDLAWRHGPGRLRLLAGLGGKVYFDRRVFDQDVLVGQLGVEERVRVAEVASLGVSGDYYDAAQLAVAPLRHRDFRSGTALARVWLGDERGELGLRGGYHGFQYKPDGDFDFHAAQVGALATARWRRDGSGHGHELDFSVAADGERRFFAGLQQRLDEVACPPGKPILPTCLVTGRARRDDWYLATRAELTYVGPLLVGLGYELQLDRSNSFGQSLLRHLVTLKLAFRIPGDLYATLKTQLLVARYLDPVLLDRRVNTQTFVTIDDENRNALVVDLERPLGRAFALDARYSLYTNEIASSPVSFLRQVVYLGLTYRVGAR